MTDTVVTGAASFIGGVLCTKLRRQGETPIALDTVPAGEGSIQIDIRDRSVGDVIPEGCRSLIHLAAISRDPDCRADPRLAFDVNVTGTLNLIDAARRRNVGQIIFASSEWVYGDVRNDEVQVEAQPIDSMAVQSEYALTKIVGEQSLKLAQKQGLGAVTILRFGIVYGPRPANWSAVEMLFDSVRTKDEITVGSLKTARRFIHVDDIIDGIAAARGRTGYEVFNLSGNTLISLGDVIAASTRLLGKQPKIVESNPAKISIRNPDNAKLREAFGWQPAIGLEQGLATLKKFFEETA